MTRAYYFALISTMCVVLSGQTALIPEDSGVRPARTVITNAMVIDGGGTPANGPQTIVIIGDRITAMLPGVGGSGIKQEIGDKLINAAGKYVMPGLINAHGHVQDERAGVAMRQDFQFQLWLASGITSVRDVGSNFEKSKVWRAKSAAGEIAAPRLFLYPVFGMNPAPSAAGEAAIHARMKQLKEGGADGMKFFEISDWAMKIMQEDAHALGIRTAHHAAVAETNAWHDIKYGTTTIEHWYGIPDAALRNGVQDFPPDFNHQYEVDRFRHAGHLFRQADPEKLVEVLSGMVKAGVAWSPTLSIYEAARDLVRYQHQPFFAEYLHPALEKFFAPNANNHGSFFLNWTSVDEAEWRGNYRLWMDAVRRFGGLGGTIVVGEDAGFIYNLFGFGLIRGMELLEEAGFKPLQVITQVTANGAKVLGKEEELGHVRPGYLADLLVIDGNPLADFRILYPKTRGVVQSGKIEWTIKDGIPYHAPTLATNAREIVAADRKKMMPNP